ncbi:hypothetical protein C4K00_4965 [Pseudomonas synxantha]|nr:hypothetical protein C4K00_4965 [Pseudomonas synxantha]AZE80780.1 hypothetical protein C4J99_5033 [Pseudomonas synxantha]
MSLFLYFCDMFHPHVAVGDKLDIDQVADYLGEAIKKS